MTDNEARWSVLLPCSDGLALAVPQNCLAEIVTLHAAREKPPEKIRWRNESVPVINFARDEESGWREEHGGSGLLAIFRGLQGEGCDYWAIAVRGEGLKVRNLAVENIEDAPEEVLEIATAAFTLDDRIYQVPDLTSLQQKIAASLEAA